MSDDLVTRLRERQHTVPLYRDAADEIERLRNTAEGWQRAEEARKDRAAAVSQWKAAKERAERAEAAEAHMRKRAIEHVAEVNGYMQRIERLEAENAALRALLLRARAYGGEAQ